MCAFDNPVYDAVLKGDLQRIVLSSLDKIKETCLLKG